MCVLLCQRLRDVYYSQLGSECPQRDVLYHCALGLSLTCMPGDEELAVSILEQLLAAGYMRAQCRLQLAKCLQREGRIVRARRLLTDCLMDDPTDADALDFQSEFDAAVKRDGKIALYGLMGLVAAIAIGWTAYRRGSTTSSSTSGGSSYADTHSGLERSRPHDLARSLSRAGSGSDYVSMTAEFVRAARLLLAVAAASVHGAAVSVRLWAAEAEAAAVQSLMRLFLSRHIQRVVGIFAKEVSQQPVFAAVVAQWRPHRLAPPTGQHSDVARLVLGTQPLRRQNRHTHEREQSAPEIQLAPDNKTAQHNTTRHITTTSAADTQSGQSETRGDERA